MFQKIRMYAIMFITGVGVTILTVLRYNRKTADRDREQCSNNDQFNRRIEQCNRSAESAIEKISATIAEIRKEKHSSNDTTM